MRHFLWAIAVLLTACQGSPPPLASPQTASSQSAATPITITSEATFEPEAETCNIRSTISTAQRDRLPKSLPQPRDADDYDSLHANWGIGYLEVTQKADFQAGIQSEQGVHFYGFDWISQNILPLYDSPDGSLEGWIACGWVIEADHPEMETPLEPHLIQSGYESWTYIVLQEQDNWLQFRYSRSGLIGGGIAWISKDDLAIGLVALDLVRWSDEFQPNELRSSERNPDTLGWLFFRDRNTSYALQANPSETAALITSIGEDHGIEPLEIQGDWMRVMVVQPRTYCIGSTPDTPVHEGWIRWRDNQSGTWLSYYPRGC